jgi:hypothetical protein
MAKATLVAHAGTREVTREELTKIPATEQLGKFHTPVRHIELVETIEDVLRIELKAKITTEKFSVGLGGYGYKNAAMFGVMTITYGERKDLTAALGFRHSNDRSMSIQLIAGMTVFVCDNMVMNGDTIILREKHMKGLDLAQEITGGLGQFKAQYKALTEGVKTMKETVLTDDGAKARILDAFYPAQVMPGRFLPAVVKEYLEPRHEEFRSRTMWSLHNAFTEVAKQMPVTPRLRATQELGRLFGLKEAA